MAPLLQPLAFVRPLSVHERTVSMPDRCWAKFEFVAENEDELYFAVGEQIEILERDDAYGDGWWRVSCLSSVGTDGRAGSDRGWQGGLVPDVVHNRD